MTDIALKKIAGKGILTGGIAAGVEYASGGDIMKGAWMAGSQVISTGLVSTAAAYESPAQKLVDTPIEQRYVDGLLTGVLYTATMKYLGKGSMLKHFLLGSGISLASDVLYSDISSLM
jgi:hypothetical protein